jgi:hypothetical protein
MKNEPMINMTIAVGILITMVLVLPRLFAL